MAGTTTRKGAQKKTAANAAVATPVVSKAVAKKPAAKKAAVRTIAAVKRTVAKGAPTKQPAVRRTVAENHDKVASAKKTPAGKTPAKKPVAKNTVAKKTAATKTAATKTAVKKAPARKTVAKPAARRTVARTGAGRPSTESAARKLSVKSGEEPWTTAELAEVRGELDTDRARLRSELNLAEHELHDLMVDAGEGAGNDQADVGSATFERDHEIRIARNSRDMLEQTERALSRIDDGSYGVCESCGEPIGKLRVMAFPRATLCLSCKQREERR